MSLSDLLYLPIIIVIAPHLPLLLFSQNGVLYAGGAGLLNKVYVLPPDWYVLRDLHPEYWGWNTWFWSEFYVNMPWVTTPPVIGKKLVNEPKMPAGGIPVSE